MIIKESDYEVIIVGGSYAGLSAAMTLGRAVRRVLIIDSGKPCNRQTLHSHNFITHDGNPPAVIAEQAKAQVLDYPTVTFQTDRVTTVEGSEGNFTIRTESDNIYSARRLLFTTGIEDIMPDIPGFAECWGISVIHCPYCHGYEVKEKNTGILTNGEIAYEFARLIRHWTSQVTIFSNGPVTFDREEVERLEVSIVDDRVQEIVHNEGHLSYLIGSSGHQYQLDALYARPAFRQHCPIPEQLGCQLTEAGHIEVDGFQKTSVPGIYAAGDSTDPFRAVSMATAAGTRAGAFINHEFIQEEEL
ncbi:MAG: NAD(P)/FAD-dependent oxidoreductase [Bacteroidota bacterium]